MRFGDSRHCRGFVGGGLAVVAEEQHFNIAAELLRGGEGVTRRFLRGGVVVFGDEQD